MTIKKSSRILPVLALLLTSVPAAAADDGYWLHVRVDEGKGEGAKVTINLPLALVGMAAPMVPEHALSHATSHLDEHNIGVSDLRSMWSEIRQSPDMTFVTVEEKDETVKVWKEKDYLFVEVIEGGEEEVRVRIPVNVVDAFLGGEEGDLQAAVTALAKMGGGELVTVNDRKSGDRVRVWVDEIPEAGRE